MRIPEEDGITHINIYSKAQTSLGRFLTNFSHSPIETEDGHFESIEGYWYWLGCTHKDKDKLRKLSGFKAKQVGRELRALDWQDSPEFKRKICDAITYKIKNSKFLQEFLDSKLPFCHYYNYGGKVVEPEDGRWVIEHIENLRTMMKNNNKEIASIETQEDYDNVLEYIKAEAQEVDIEEPYIYTEHYEIKVEKGFERIYDEIEKIFSTSPDCLLDEVESKYPRDLFGKDHRNNVVNVDVKDDLVYIFYLNGTEETLPARYWACAETNLDGKMSRMEGNCSYKYIREFPTKEGFDNFKKKYYGKIFTAYDLAENQMMIYGLSLFRETTVKEVSILSFDIETNGTKIDKSSHIYTISNTFRKGDFTVKKVFRVDHYKSVMDMIVDWEEFVSIHNPSIITGHNIMSFDLPYINQVCKNNKTTLNLGRDLSSIKISNRSKKYRVDGSQTWEYRDINIFGRHVIDTLFLSVKYDIGRNFPSWGLKPIIQHLGLIKEGRQFYDAGKISENWDNLEERERIVKYCEDDSDDSLALFDIMSPSFFYLNRSIPKSFQQMINGASGSWLNSIIVRSYLQDNHSIAKADESSKVTGGVSFGIPANHSNCFKIDISSLYPSIMRQYEIGDIKKDPRLVFYKTVDYYTLERLKNKKLAKETGEQYFTDLEQSQKVAINSLFGLLGTNGLNYNNFALADKVTSIGRRILSETMRFFTGKDVTYWFAKEFTKKEDYQNAEHDLQYEQFLPTLPHKYNFTMVNADTDSIAFKKKDESHFTEKEREELIKDINSHLPEKIVYEDDGYFLSFVVSKAKNYVLYDGKKIKTKGSSFKDAKKEPALKELMDRIVKESFIFKTNTVPNIYKDYVKEVLDIKDISRWATKKNITKAVLENDRTTEAKVRDALEDIDVKEGDKVFIYSAIEGEIQATDKNGPIFMKRTGEPKMIPNRVLKLVENFEKDKIDIEHYLNRVYDTVDIFKNIVDMDEIIDYTKSKNKGLLKEL